MSGMLNALLDINQIETGAVKAHPVSFHIGDLLDRLRDEFSYHANAQGLTLRSVPCHLMVQSDPRLLEQILRNLLSNALKYTAQGRVLLGCRRHQGWLSIQVCDTGAGIPDEQLQAIFEEYHQLDNPARERSRGLGLGLSIVQRLSTLLGHKILVQSTLGKGSIFSIEVALAEAEMGLPNDADRPADSDSSAGAIAHKGMILLVEDDPELRELLGTLLKDQGHQMATAKDGVAALDWLEHSGIQPDLILADFNLPRGLTGLQLTVQLREKMHRDIPAIILTGDISAQTSRDVMREHCTQLNKPAKLKEVTYVIQKLLSQSASNTVSTPSSDSATDVETPIVYVVDDDEMLRETIRTVLEADDHEVEDFATCEAFLASYKPGREACLLVDANLPGMKGVQLLRHLREAGDDLAAIMITGTEKNASKRSSVCRLEVGKNVSGHHSDR